MRRRLALVAQWVFVLGQGIVFVEPTGQHSSTVQNSSLTVTPSEMDESVTISRGDILQVIFTVR